MAQAPDREAGQRANEQGQEHYRQADNEAVAELMPEALEIPEGPMDDDAEGLQCRRLGMKLPAKDRLVAVERDQPHVVERRDRPDEKHEAKQETRRLDPIAPAAGSAAWNSEVRVGTDRGAAEMDCRHTDDVAVREYCVDRYRMLKTPASLCGISLNDLATARRDRP